MIVTRLAGGLGNQMFEYAAGLALARRHGTDLKLDLCEVIDPKPRPGFVLREYDLPIFSITASIFPPEERALFRGRKPLWQRVARKICRQLVFSYSVVVEKHYHYDPRVARLPDNVYLEGYWQSWRYFDSVADDVRKEFTLRDEPGAAACAMAARIQDTNAVCLNVRRTDFVDNPLNSRVHGFCGLDYICAGVAAIAERVPAPHFFVFSDDMEWCRNNIDLEHPVTFVAHDCAGPKFGEYLDLMKRCRHFVIPNSTFGWWAAWLCQQPDPIVIVPKRWFKQDGFATRDLIPDRWMRI